MKKLMCVIATMCGMMFSGCDFNEQATLNATTVAGTLAVTTWFAIDDPGDIVKAKMQEVIVIIKDMSKEGVSNLDAIYPVIEQKVVSDVKLTDIQKQLILSGSTIILGALDEVFIQKPEIAQNSENVKKYIYAFCNGCDIALKLDGNSTTIKNSKKIFNMRIRARNISK